MFGVLVNYLDQARCLAAEDSDQPGDSAEDPNQQGVSAVKDLDNPGVSTAYCPDKPSVSAEDPDNMLYLDYPVLQQKIQATQIFPK